MMANVGRYDTFERETYSALQELGKHFIYNFINAQGSYTEVENNIIKEMEYQSSTELQPALGRGRRRRRRRRRRRGRRWQRRRWQQRRRDWWGQLPRSLQF